MAEVGSSPNRGGMLDQAPPQPPGGQKRSLMDTQQQSGAGLGADAANPQIMAMQYFAQVQQGFEGLGSLLPQLMPAFTQIIQGLQQAIPQAMADQLSGADSTGAAVSPGGAPGAMPPGGPPPGGAPAGAPMGA